MNETHGAEAASETASACNRWRPIAVLALSTFLVVTSEMLPVGVLTPMSDSLQVSDGTVGYSLAITGIVTAVSAPLIVRVIGRLDRRLVLAAAMALLAAANLITALAQNFPALAGSRVLLGIALGGVWALASAVAPSSSGRSRRPRQSRSSSAAWPSPRHWVYRWGLWSANSSDGASPSHSWLRVACS
ncbi:putative MFS family arabinose efflux permease [Rhodococcus sp. 27YEA15]|uniref:MFS transporter n=1 Tax=Rhodococcus sp. 27YEA15 TaxID=3156259 RepID=UPI003C7E2E06